SSPAPCSPTATPKAAQISGRTPMGRAGVGVSRSLVIRVRGPDPPPTLTRPRKGGGNQVTEDVFHRAIGVLQRFIVPDPDHLEASRFQPSRPFPIFAC